MKAPHALALSLGLAALGTLALALASPQPMSRQDILNMAKPAIGYSYWWGHGRFRTDGAQSGSCSGSCPSCTHSGQYGGDCSGLAAKAWQIPSPTPLDEDDHPYSTVNFRNDTTHWKPISRKDAEAGDAFTYNTSGHGHIFLYEKGDPWGSLWAYECSGCKVGCIHGTRSAGSDYIAIRRDNLKDDQPIPPVNNPPTGYLDQATCTTVSGWSQDPNAPTASIDVHIYFNGPAGAAGAIGRPVKADVKRDDLCQALGSCNHGFTIALPLGLKDGKPHEVHAYGIDQAGGSNAELKDSPKTVTCALPPAPPGPAIRRHILSQDSLASWNFSTVDQLQHVTDAVAATFPDGPDWPTTPVAVQADDGTPEVWFIDGNWRRHVPDPAVLSAWQLDGDAVIQWPAAQVYALPQGVDLRPTPVLIQASGAAVWLLDDAEMDPTGTGGQAGMGQAGSGAAGQAGSGAAGQAGSGQAGAGQSGSGQSGGASQAGGAGGTTAAGSSGGASAGGGGASPGSPAAGSGGSGTGPKTAVRVTASGGETANESGCAVGPRSAAGSWAPLGLAGLLLAAGRRRRQARR